MVTVIDTNILFDILSGVEPQAQTAQDAVRAAGLQGRLVMPMICSAELAGYFSFQGDLDRFLARIPVTLLALDPAASFLAGTFHKAYRRRGGTRTRVLADFIVAAQAQLGADRLLTTDKRFFGASFPRLVSVSPANLLP